jgi:hypothetical protein
MKSIFGVIIALVFSLKTFGGNVTLITHGFGNSAGDTNKWLWNMAYRIGDYEKRSFEFGGNTNRTFYVMYFDNGLLKSKLLFGSKPSKNRSGDITIVLGWDPYSGDISAFVGNDKIKSTVEISNQVSEFLMTDGSFDGIIGPISQFPIHLIGHSRGGSLVCEIGKRLGEWGIYVHQITTLDPHPFANDGFSGISVQDGSAKNGIQKNVIFADNYYQRNGDPFGNNPEGTYVNGAANIDLSDEVLSQVTLGTHSHSLVRFWYYTTLFEKPIFTTDGELSLRQSDRTKWFKWYDTNGITSGYAYSFRAGQRLDWFSASGYDKDVLNSIQYGLGNDYGSQRLNIPERKYKIKSKNIIKIDYNGKKYFQIKPYTYGEPINFTRTTRIGDENLEFSIIYQADFPNNTPFENIPIRIIIDDDENTYNDVIESELYTVPSTGEWVLNKATVNISNIVSRLKTPGQYSVGAIIGDGFMARTVYSNHKIIVEPDAKIEFKYTEGSSNYGFFLYGTVDREYLFQRSYDLKKWEQISTGRFMKFEDGNPSGRDVIYSSGMGPQAYWRLVYK